MSKISIAEEDTVTIKGVKEKVITLESVRYYKNHYCKCNCGDRIQVREIHKWYGVPKYICGHNHNRANRYWDYSD